MNSNDFINRLDNWLATGDINGKKINQDNLNRLNKANILAIHLFKPKEIDFPPPQQNLSFAEATLITERIEFEGAQQREKYREFLSLLDYYNVSPITSTELGIGYHIHGVWEE